MLWSYMLAVGTRQLLLSNRERHGLLKPEFEQRLWPSAPLISTLGVIRREGPHLRLEELGIHGNGHITTLEKNNQVIAGVLADWLEKDAAPRGDARGPDGTACEARGRISRSLPWLPVARRSQQGVRGAFWSPSCISRPLMIQ
jgi:hypothetical protein